MKLKTYNYVKEYIMLCSQMCKMPEDYTKENVIRHNIAMRKLNKLKENMYIDNELTENVYRILLECEDAYAQQAAATDCLQLNIYIDASVKILKKISRCGDKISAIGAKRTLLIWEGKLDPIDPF